MSDISQNIRRKIKESNKIQRNAIDSIVEGWEGEEGEFIFPIIEGPPGTGKTRVGVLSAGRYFLEKRKPQIAYLAYTNYAADKAREDFFKLGFDSEDVIRLTPNSRERDWENGIVGCNSNVNDLTPEEQRRIGDTPILISTIYSSVRIFKKQPRPLIIIDEFSQVNPSMFFSMISKVRTTKNNPSGYVLLGDPNQLPVITSQPLLMPNIGTFVLSRKDYESHQMVKQYRMNKEICRAVNALREALRTYPLKTDESVRNRTLTNLGTDISYTWNNDNCPPDFREILNPKNPCVIINTDNLSGWEEIGFGESKYYPSEARLATRLAHMITQSYKDKNNSSLLPTVLSPYTAQIGAIRNYLQDEELQKMCTTIYKAQGREYPCVIISFVRKNRERDIGFLKDQSLQALTYVGCSRAMAKLIILLSFSTFEGYRDYNILLDRCSNKALIIDADQSWGDKND